MLCRLVISDVSGAFAAFIFRVVQEELDCFDKNEAVLSEEMSLSNYQSMRVMSQKTSSAPWEPYFAYVSIYFARK